MTAMLSAQDLAAIRHGYHPDPARSLSLSADAYTEPRWVGLERDAIFAATWQWVCHVEKLRAPGRFVAVEIAGRPIAVVRDREGTLRAFYNVCKHRAHGLLQGEGEATRIMCPYHAWTYRLDGQLVRAPHTERLTDFDPAEICLDQVRVEEFCGFVYVNLDPEAAPLAAQSGDLAAEVLHWAPDVERLTHAHRLTYSIRSNWKNVVDNFLE
ncbi:MAG: aromatic ring-hydroxylating dioxygenase subunit alpha, partial [Pseudomonadota bacterium]